MRIAAAGLPAGGTLRLRPEGGSFRTVSAGSQTLEPGRYTVEFRADGYETDSRTFTIAAGQSQTWSPTVRQTQQPEQPPAPTTGTVRIDRSQLPAGSTITLRRADGSTSTVTDATLQLSPGSYTLEFSADGYRPFSGSVRVTAGGNETWRPTVAAVATPPVNAPTRDAAADRAAIETAVRDFVAAFGRRDVDTVVPLLPAAQRDPWRQLLTDRSNVTNFRASVASLQPATVDGDQASVTFSVQLQFDNRNVDQSPVLQYVGAARRIGQVDPVLVHPGHAAPSRIQDPDNLLLF